MIKLKTLILEDREVKADMLSKILRAAYISIFDIDAVYIDEARDLMPSGFLHNYVAVRISMIYKNREFKIYNKFYHYKFPPEEMDNLTSIEWTDMLRAGDKFPHVVTKDTMIKGNDPLMAFIASVYEGKRGLEPIIRKRNILSMITSVKELIDKQDGNDPCGELDPTPIAPRELEPVAVGESVKEISTLEELKMVGRTAKKHAAYFLEQAGLEHPEQFIMKIRPIKVRGLENALAIYKHSSILSGRPIFWMNANLPEMIKKWDDPMPVIRILTDNIIHEWWHAISELLRVMKYGQQKEVKSPIPEKYGQKEEDEAMAFVGWVFYGEGKEYESYFKLAIKEFNAFSVYD